MQCPICRKEIAASQPLAAYGSNGGKYFSCPVCYTIFLRPLPDRFALNSHFNKEMIAADLSESEKARRNVFIRYLTILESMVDNCPNSLFEIGYASGEFLLHAHNAGWSVSGCEMSQALAERARKRIPQSLHSGDFLALDIDSHRGRYDAVVALDVLEHVVDPWKLLEKCHELLSENGLLIMQTPNTRSIRARFHRSKWNMLIPEYHFHLFSPSSISKLLSESGFAPVLLESASGSGEEIGLARIFAKIKSNILNISKLGNALLVISRKL